MIVSEGSGTVCSRTQVTNYAKDSTIDIGPDRWGNLFVYVNGEDVVVMPKPFAIDAAGKRFELDFDLDKKAKTITVAGDLTGAKYPVTVDPTERVTNGGFELGCWYNCGWSNVIGNTNYYIVRSDTPYEGTYYLDVVGAGGYSGIRQTLYYDGISTVSNAVSIPVRNTYDLPLSNVWYSYGNWDLNNPAQIPHGWLVRSTTASITGSSTLDIWTYSNTHGHLDSISVVDLEPPVADFTGTPLSGTAPLTVQFTDLSTNAPTSWSWSFGDGGTSALQIPSHQYTSAGTYTVSLTVANAAGSDGETKAGYVVVTTPVLNQATDIEGRTDWPALYTDVPVYASNIQNSMGYNAQPYLTPDKTTILSRLPSDSLFHFNGHGEAGRFQIDDQSDIWITGSELNSLSYPNMKFALFQCCNCGQDSTENGNLVSRIAGNGNGQTCAFGFYDELLRINGAIQYAQGFWDAASQGFSPSDSHSAAIQRLDAQQVCVGTPDTHCNYDSLVASGICSQALTIPASMMAGNSWESISDENSVEIPEGIITNAEKTIAAFTGTPANSLKYQRTEKTPHGDMYEFINDDGWFTIDSITGRVKFARFKAFDKIDNQIEIENAQKQAETFARSKYPEFWITTDEHSVKRTESRVIDHGSLGKEYSFTWRDVYHPQKIESLNRYEITGLAAIHITVSNSGDVTMYSESYVPDEPDIDLIPELTEEQAWDIARLYYKQQGIDNISSADATSYGLVLWDDIWNDLGWPKYDKQYLAWKFFVKQKEQHTIGGEIVIDAHDGQIIDYGEIA